MDWLKRQRPNWRKRNQRKNRLRAHVSPGLTVEDFSRTRSYQQRICRGDAELSPMGAIKPVRGRAANRGAGAKIIRLPVIPLFLHRAKHIRYRLPSVPETVLTLLIPARCLKRAISGKLRPLAINQNLEAIYQLPIEADARRESCEPGIPFQPDTTHEPWLNFVCRTQDI